MADFLEWDARFNLGIPPMDDEHRLIVETMNQLHALSEAAAPRQQVTKVMSQLVQITRGHFEDEEAYMESIGFPGLRTHRHIHASLLVRLVQFETEIRAGGAASPELFGFLKMWLKAHICGIDTQYVAFGQVA
jgi:hemerythrin-like metal-binding protein